MKTWIPADWPAPENVHAGTTTRLAGLSPAPFDSFNLAGHVGDEPDAVAGNRQQLQRRLNLPAQPLWLQQQHGATVLAASQARIEAAADGAYTTTPGRVCAVLTADCVPLLLCSRNGAEIAALHIGWRGLCKRIIRHGLSQFDAAPDELLAWIGPHISQENYEVGTEVIAACASILEETQDALRPSRANHGYLSLGGLVKTELRQAGVTAIHDCRQCTSANPALFYSHRRDGVTGRMASLIWMDDKAAARN